MPFFLSYLSSCSSSIKRVQSIISTLSISSFFSPISSYRFSLISDLEHWHMFTETLNDIMAKRLLERKAFWDNRGECHPDRWVVKQHKRTWRETNLKTLWKLNISISSCSSIQDTSQGSTIPLSSSNSTDWRSRPASNMPEPSWRTIMEKIKIEGKRIYLYSHQIDMRMGMQKIQVLLSQNFSPSELQDSIFVFISRSRKIAKVYVEDEFGRWLMIRKLNYTSFKIPRADEDGKLTSKDIKYLMDGAEILSERKRIKYAWGLFSKSQKKNKNVIIFIWKWKLSILPKTSN